MPRYQLTAHREKPMLNIGLTGNVAAGKSTVARLFAKWGATVIDADEIAREVQAPGSSVMNAIEAKFGERVIQDSGKLDRATLRRIVLENPDGLASLNAIVHPAVQRRRAELAQGYAQRGDCVLVNDIPLLFEALSPDMFDAVVLIDAPEDVRRDRIMHTRGLSSDEALRLIGVQMPADEKRPLSRFVIDNVSDVDDLESAAWEVWSSLRREAAGAMAGEGGSLLAMFAHPDDETFAVGGTLARYAQAGCDVHVWCATAGEAGKLHGESTDAETARPIRLREVDHAARILGVKQVHTFDFPDGALRGDSAAGREAAADAIRRLAPDVVITFGADGATGHGDHIAVHEWVRAAWEESNLPSRLFFITYPLAVAEATEGRLAGSPEDKITASLDIRPWGDIKTAAIEAHASQRFPFSLDTPLGAQLLEREWFAEAGGGVTTTDLFDRRPTA